MRRAGHRDADGLAGHTLEEQQACVRRVGAGLAASLMQLGAAMAQTAGPAITVTSWPRAARAQARSLVCCAVETTSG